MNALYQQLENASSDEQHHAAALLRLAQEPTTVEQYCKRPSIPSTSTCNPTILNEALNKLTTAVARLHRAGPTSKRKSEAFWIFIAGSWSRHKFDEEVREARTKLPKAISAEEDVMKAKGLIGEAIAMLTKGDIRDARDLEGARRAFERGTLW